jgi:hypothetical protein
MSNEPTIAEMNYAIGVFNGRSFSGSHITDYKSSDAPKMKYHSDWNWLMPVCHAIREKAFVLRSDEKANKLLAKLNTQLLFGTIADVHLRAFHFIEYINNQLTTTNEITPKSI